MCPRRHYARTENAISLFEKLRQSENAWTWEEEQDKLKRENQGRRGKKKRHCVAGRGGETRTPDLLLPKQAPYRWATPRLQMQSYHAWTRVKGQICEIVGSTEELVVYRSISK
jgi:hypothetical protein